MTFDMSKSPTPRTATVAGATGLVGGHILRTLLADATVNEVHALSRRPLGFTHPKLHEHRVDFSALASIPCTSELYLALGTTIKVAGSQAAFRAVDLDANLAVAKAALRGGTQRVGLVSAVDANSESSTFYNQVKGELEDALRALPFKGLVIAQPSLLLDDRTGLQQPIRWGERIAIPVARLLSPFLPGKYQPVKAEAVAKALIARVPQSTGVEVLPSHMLIKLGQSAHASPQH